MATTIEPSELLVRAAEFAGQAPSLHNSQPWCWQVAPGSLRLRLEPARVLRVSDPAGRLAILICGAALHHARVHLAAQGWPAEVDRLPSPEDPDLL